MGATLDHLSGGRWGINLVSGWSAQEFAMMGVELLPHAERYQRTAAFIEILRGLWTAPPGTFDHSSPWYRVEHGVSLPQPERPPPIANAGTSGDARAVIARLCDWAFISTPTLDATPAIVADIKGAAAAAGRQVRAAAFPFVLWRDSADEAEAEIARIIAHKDTVAAQNWLDGLNLGSGSFDRFTLDMLTVGAGAVHVTGTARDVAEKLAALHAGGLDAVLMVFQAYLRDTERFAREVMPLLREMGVIGAAGTPRSSA